MARLHPLLLPASLLLACAGGEDPTTGFATVTMPMNSSTGMESTSGMPAPTTSGPESTSGGPGGTGESGTGPDTDSGASNATTEALPVCGDGKVEGGEACDDGNAVNTDDCLDICKKAACGDGFVQVGVEECDDANVDNDDECLDTCVAAKCGDGFVQGDEGCDDGNAENTDGCLGTCVAAVCGDGLVWEGVEGCDDGNQVDDDACSNLCAAASCGDGVKQMGEGCDDGNQVNTDGCLDTCQPAKCGDGFVQAGVEECDAGGMNNDNTGPCRTDCTECDCQGNDLKGKTCKDIPGFNCGTLACGGCGFKTSMCVSAMAPNFMGQVGPDFSADGCWQQCEGYLDQPGGDEVPKEWGNDCVGTQFKKLRIACGASTNQYRFITVNKNVFKDGLNAYPEMGLITEAKDQNKNDFVTQNQIYATGNHPHTGVSWWGNGNGCNEASLSVTINNGCSWEASNCFGQNLGGPRYLWVYVSP